MDIEYGYIWQYNPFLNRKERVVPLFRLRLVQIMYGSIFIWHKFHGKGEVDDDVQ